MKILVLGSEGQIGKPLCKYLRHNRHEVIGLDIVNHPDQDLRHNYFMHNVHFQWADFVIFLAFDVGGSQYLKKYEHTKEFLDNNVKIMQTVFNLLNQYSKPFIFASSQMSNMTHSAYGVLKKLGEFYTKSLNGLVVKFWNVYGVETDPNKTHVITDFINAAYKNKHISMLTDGLEERQFLHVNDCSNALLTLIEQYNNLDKSEDYCITSFMWHDIRKVAEIIAKEFNATVSHAPEKDIIQKGFRNEPTHAIIKYWHPTIPLHIGINMVIKDMGLKNES